MNNIAEHLTQNQTHWLIVSYAFSIDAGGWRVVATCHNCPFRHEEPVNEEHSK